MWKDFPQALCDAAHVRGLVYSRPGYGRSTPRAFMDLANFLIQRLNSVQYGLALGTAALHVLGSLLMTVLGIKTALFLIAYRAQ